MLKHHLWIAPSAHVICPSAMTDRGARLLPGHIWFTSTSVSGYVTADGALRASKAQAATQVLGVLKERVDTPAEREDLWDNVGTRYSRILWNYRRRVAALTKRRRGWEFRVMEEWDGWSVRSC